MKIIQNFLLIFFFLFITNNLYAGLGDSEMGAGGWKRNIEVNEIEEIDTEDKEDEFIENNNPNKFETIELKDIDPNTVGTIIEDKGGLGYDMWSGSKRNIIKEYLMELKGGLLKKKHLPFLNSRTACRHRTSQFLAG